MKRSFRLLAAGVALGLWNLSGSFARAECVQAPLDLLSLWAAEGNVLDSISSNNGALWNGPTFGPGEVGQAFVLDGVDDYIDIGVLPELQGATGITVLAWINKADNNNEFAGFVGKWDTLGSPNNSFLLYNGEGPGAHKGAAAFQFDDNSIVGVGGGTTIPTNQWVLLATTWRSSDGLAAIYKNGTLDGSAMGGAGRTLKFHQAYLARIGDWGVLHNQSAYKFKGEIDEAMIFNRALSQAEIQGIYNAGPSGLCQTGLTTVGNKNDKGLGSLRAAVHYANAHPGPDTIAFTPAVTDLLSLPSDQLTIADDLTIAGPGARVLSVTGSFLHRVFEIEAGKTVTISDLSIRDGIVSVDTGVAAGGGILNNGNLTLTRCRVFNNIASHLNAQAHGGGIYNGATGTLLVQKCEISGNLARSSAASGSHFVFGGGLFNYGAATLTDTTVSGNVLGSGPSHQVRVGAGICTTPIGNSPGSVLLKNCTITANVIDASVFGFYRGGGIYTDGLVTLSNTIVADNVGAEGPDVRGFIVSQGHNLIRLTDGSGGWNTNAGDPHHDLTGSTANGAQPAGLANGSANNGGPTDTYALLAGSAAIDAGNDANASSTDQRGFVRVGVSDIGAFEFGGTAPTPTPVPARLANISTRLRVETGDNVLIGGFIVTGTQPKKVIIRAIGTSLPLVDKLADPTLELHGPSGLIEANDNWIDSPNRQAIIDSTIPPTSDFESAIVQTLPAAAGYTAIVRGVNNSTGIGAVEAYDLDTTVDSRLANISTRGFVQTGDNVLIAGTIVVGQASQRVLIRAIGPSLPIAGVMGNPTLELRDASGTLLQANDNWVESADKQAIIDTTIPPTNDLESAIVATLPANNASYTAIVRGVNDTTGIAVVEVYALD